MLYSHTVSIIMLSFLLYISLITLANLTMAAAFHWKLGSLPNASTPTAQDFHIVFTASKTLMGWLSLAD